MPIVRVEIVGEAPAGLAREIADAAGAALGARPGGTWVTVRTIDSYAESAGGPPPGVEPVFVRVLQSNPPTGEAFRSVVEGVTRAVAAACGRALENVHVIWEPPANGRVAFGGTVVE